MASMPNWTNIATSAATAGSTLRPLRRASAAATGISSLKVRFNNVFGYYIEISKANLQLAPAAYERKQTLANAERFTTPELKELESKVLAAEERILELERERLPRSTQFCREPRRKNQVRGCGHQ